MKNKPQFLMPEYRSILNVDEILSINLHKDDLTITVVFKNGTREDFGIDTPFEWERIAKALTNYEE
jgi:hypothetical protein